MVAAWPNPTWHTFQDYGLRELACISELLDGYSQQVLSYATIPEGGSCLEIGAGMGSMATWLAEQVGANGYVLATDLVVEPIPRKSFDLIHARLVLGHIGDAERIVHELAAAVKPGGTLVLSDWEPRGRELVWRSDSPNAGELFDAFYVAMQAILTEDGADLGWSRRAPTVMREAGLNVYFTSVTDPCSRGGRGFCRLLEYHTELLQDRLVDAGMSTFELAAFRRLLLDPKLCVSSYPLRTAMAHRPVSGLL